MMFTCTESTDLKSPPKDQKTDRLRVVIVDEELPYPLTSGKRIRTFNLIQRLAHRHELTYLCHRNLDREEEQQAQAVFRDLGIETVIVDRTVPRKSGPGFYARLGWNLLSSLPYSVATHNSSELRAAIQNHAAEHPVDLWHCEWTPYAEPLSCLPDACRLVMAHNVESMIWQRYWETESNPVKRWYIYRQWKKFKAFEERSMQAADCGVAVSQADADHFHQELNAPGIEVVDNGVDTEMFQPSETPRHRNQILFLGSLDWRPNLDGAQQLLDHIFPKVRKQRPEAELVIVGRNPPQWLQQRAGAERGVTLHANVPSVTPFLHESMVMAVPLRIGGGSRLKILEALATELPVVSTSVGAEGLNLTHEEHLMIANDPAEFATTLVEQMNRPDDAILCAKQGRQRILEQYDWGALSERLEQIWLRCAHNHE